MSTQPSASPRRRGWLTATQWSIVSRAVRPNSRASRQTSRWRSLRYSGTSRAGRSRHTTTVRPLFSFLSSLFYIISTIRGHKQLTRRLFVGHSAPPQAVDRRTSFFATIEASADIEGGATWFGRVTRPAWARLQPWCERGLLDCSYDVGLAVRPVQGNAVFWVNFRENGEGHEGTAHGGEPVVKGSKIGLNIWTIARLREE